MKIKNKCALKELKVSFTKHFGKNLFIVLCRVLSLEMLANNYHG
jgi:hypothetical protein